VVDQLDLDFGNVAEAQDRVIVPGGGGDAALLKADLLPHHEARALDDTALDLIAGAVRGDDEAGVGGAPNFLQADLFVHFKLDDHGGEGGDVVVAGDAAARGAPIP